MTGTETRYEYGYRLEDGREVWSADYGTDGAWMPDDPASGMPAIDMWDDSGDPDRIRKALRVHGVAATVLRRLVTVTTGPIEEVPE